MPASLPPAPISVASPNAAVTPVTPATALEALGGFVTVQAPVRVLMESVPTGTWMPLFALVADGRVVGVPCRSVSNDCVFVRFQLPQTAATVSQTSMRARLTPRTVGFAIPQRLLVPATAEEVVKAASSCSLAAAAAAACAGAHAHLPPVTPTLARLHTTTTFGGISPSTSAVVAPSVYEVANNNSAAGGGCGGSGADYDDHDDLSASLSMKRAPSSVAAAAALARCASLRTAQHATSVSASGSFAAPSAAAASPIVVAASSSSSSAFASGAYKGAYRPQWAKDDAPLLCVVCGRWDTDAGGQARRSGHKCRGCVGVKSTDRLRAVYAALEKDHATAGAAKAQLDQKMKELCASISQLMTLRKDGDCSWVTRSRMLMEQQLHSEIASPQTTTSSGSISSVAQFPSMPCTEGISPLNSRQMSEIIPVGGAAQLL